MSYKTSFLISFAFLFNLFGYSQSFNSNLKETITSKEGLPSDEIYHVIQDKNKFIWFATDNGIAKYDGRSFKIFNSNDGIQGNSVIHFFPQANGTIFGLTNDGNFFYIKDDIIHPYPYNHVLLKKHKDHLICHSFYMDDNLSAHIGTSLAYYVIDKEGEIKIIDFKELEPGVNSLTKFSRFNNYIFSYHLRTTDPSKSFSIIRRRDHNDEMVYNASSGIPAPTTSYGCIIDENRIAIIHNSRVYVLGETSVLQCIQLKNEPISVEYIDSSLWIGTANGGVFSYQFYGDTVVCKDQLLNGLSVTSILKDHENGYWFTTREQGVVHISDFDIVKIYESQNGLNISAFYYGIKKAFVAFENGLVTNLFDSISFNISKGYIYSMNVFENECVFFSKDGQTFKYSDEYKKLISYDFIHANTKFLAHKSYQFIKNRYVIYNLGSFLIMDAQYGEEIFLSEPINLNGRILTVNSHKNVILIGTTRGLSYFEYGNNNNIKSINLPSPVVSIMPFNGKVITACKNGDIYEIEKGLSKLNLPGLAKYSIIYDAIIKDSVLIIASNLGIQKFIYNEIKGIWIIDEFFALPNVKKIYIYQNSIYYQTKKEIYLDYNRIRSKSVPNTQIYEMFVNGRPRSLKDKMNLDYYNNNIKFILNATSFSSRFQNFRYQLIGHDKEVLYTSESEINYASLNPGNYQFIVSSTSNGIDYSKEQKLSFTINPPFYFTTWFILIAILIVIFILGLLYRQRMQKIKTKLKFNQMISELRSKALMAQLNPHLVFNTLNSIQGIISVGETEDANIYLARFSKFMRNSLELSKKNIISIENEIEITKDYISLEMIRFPEGLEIDIQNNLTNHQFMVPPLILQPFIENAIKHGIMPVKMDKGIIRIILMNEGDLLYIKVQDNGVGFKAPLNFLKGDGMRISKERLQILNPFNDIYLEVGEAKTTIVLKIHL